MIGINEGMGKEIIENMELILHRPGMELVCARYDSSAKAVNAWFANGEDSLFMFWLKLLEEVADPKKDTAHLVIVHKLKTTPKEFIDFLKHDKAPAFRLSRSRRGG